MADVLMIGDSLTSDILGAKVAGMQALHLVPGSPARSTGQVGTLSAHISQVRR
jgi:FMN phosphatase YigB (HAD superfamily)